jgi:diacylglycerol O-acyltransferase / wax synthase
MDWSQPAEPGRIWRARVQLIDNPGRLAELATRLSENGCNLLGLTVLPVPSEPADADGKVVDELVLRAPADLRRSELISLIEVGGTRCVGVTPASVTDLVDEPTAALRSATGTLTGSLTTCDAVRQVLAADSVDPVESDDGAAVTGVVVLDPGGHRATITIGSGQQLMATRAWAPFTDGELARVPALLELLDVAAAPTAAAPAAAADSAAPQRPRRQLSSLDVQFLNAETASTLTHVGALTVLDPEGAPGGRVTVGALRMLIGSRLHLVAPLRWRLHQVPLGLDLPYWIDAGTVDLRHHVREVELPAPGTDEQLGELVGRLAETPLDRAYPLWECYLVHGLAGGRQALYTKVHHAVIDGVSAAEVLAVVLDLEPRPRRVQPPEAPPRPERAPGVGEMLQRGAQRTVLAPLRLLRSAPTTLPHLVDLPGAAAVPGAMRAASVAGHIGRLAGREPTPPPAVRPPTAPKTPFNGPISSRRAFAFTSLPLDEVKAVKNARGLSVNDVVMALCTSALRRWLIGRDALPDRPLVASIPVSVRTPEQLGTGGNEISLMLTALPTDLPDPVDRLDALHASLVAAKRRFSGTPSRLLHDCAAALPQTLHGVVSRTLLRAVTLGAPPFNLLVSNVAGPQLPLYAAGARVIGNYPVSVISDVSGGINITVMSYDGHLDFGVIACKEMVPDAWTIAAYLRDALTELTDLLLEPRTDRVLAASG